MFDVHIGAPGILTSLIDRVAVNASQLNRPKLNYIVINSGEDPIRQYVENREDDLYIDQCLEDDALKSMRHLFAHDHVLISYPQLLGHVHEITGKRPFRLMDRRVTRLDDLLETREVTLHLMVVSPVDMLMTYSDLPMRSRLKLITQTRLSWANITWRILRAAPKRNLVVWNCERPYVAASAFFEAIMQRSTMSLQNGTVEIPVVPADTIEPPSAWMAGIEDEIMQLDEQFELDLQKIDEMPRVILQNL